MKHYNELIKHKGNETLYKMTEMCILSIAGNRPIHIHAQGLRGTGKTSIMRSAKEILPKIIRIKGCEYNCHPDMPHCPEHREMETQEIEKIGREYITMPFLEISHSAKLGTIVGSIDMEKIMDKKNPHAAILPGSIPRANRGIIFVDEINRLADTSPELVDVLLDVMGTKPGHVQIEESGFRTIEIPVNACVWAASNPDEEPGPLEEIRKQLSDRFDFVINVERPLNHDVVKQILINSEIEAGRTQFYNYNRVKTDFDSKLKFLSNVKVPQNIIDIIVSLYINYGIESFRGVEALLAGTKLYAALESKDTVDIKNLYYITPIALRHRVSSTQMLHILKYIDEICFKTDSEEASRHSFNQKITNNTQNKAPFSTKNINNKNKIDKKLSSFGGNGLLSKLNQFLNKAFKKTTSNSKTKTSQENNDTYKDIKTSCSKSAEINPDNLVVSAPAKKARPIRELDLSDIITTDKEFIK